MTKKKKKSKRVDTGVNAATLESRDYDLKLC